MTKGCRECGGHLEITRGPHRYTECGLSNVVLLDVEKRTCSQCGALQIVIPKVEQLHAAIARNLLSKPLPLAGDEFRFLRKFLGWSGKDCADHMDVDAATVSNWETGKNPIGPQSDRLLRMMVALGRPVDNYQLHDLLNIRHESPDHIPVQLARHAGRWQEQAGAS